MGDVDRESPITAAGVSRRGGAWARVPALGAGLVAAVLYLSPALGLRPGLTQPKPLASPTAEIKPGMSTSAVRALLGEPATLKKTQTCWGLEERWSYPRAPGLENKVLYFLDGRLDKVESR